MLSLMTGFALVLPASAGQRDGLVFRVDCDGFISRGGELIFNRDNTGQGREQVVFTATDGLGNVIYAPTTESFLVGARLTLPPGLFFGWTAAPAANPLRVEVYSPEGNGLNRQTIYTVIGNCGNVQTIATQEEITLNDYLDGITSPSVPLNTTAPRPFNTRDLTYQQPGYLIVNTDNQNLRSGDGPEYTVVAKVDGGTQLIVLGRNEARTWWFVQVDDIRGWVLGELTIIRGDLTGVPVVPVTGEIARPTLFLFDLTPLAVVPVEGSLSVCQIPGNLDYYIIGRNAKATWFELEATCNGAAVTGWVKAEEGGLRNQAESFIPVTD
jgi:hypothetical protein